MNHGEVHGMSFHREPHHMTRIDIETGIPFDQFTAALEKAAPPVDYSALKRITAAGGNWDDVVAAAEDVGGREPQGDRTVPLEVVQRLGRDITAFEFGQSIPGEHEVGGRLRHFARRVR